MIIEIYFGIYYYHHDLINILFQNSKNQQLNSKIQFVLNYLSNIYIEAMFHDDATKCFVNSMIDKNLISGWKYFN